MGTDADAGPVGGGLGVGPGVSILDQGAQEFINHVWVATAVAAALHEGQMIGVLDGLGKFLDRLRQQLGVVGDVHLFWDLRFGTLGHVQDARLALDERPLKALFATVHVDTLAVLTGDVVEEAPDVRGEIAVFNLYVAALDGELVAALLRYVIPHSAAPKTADVFGEAIDHSEARTDDVRGVMHRDHLLPIARPAVHVLRVTGGEILQLAELALIVHFLDEEKLTAVDDRLGHHVLEAGFFDGFAQLLAFLDGGGHRHGAHDMFARAQGLERLQGVIGNR